MVVLAPIRDAFGLFGKVEQFAAVVATGYADLRELEELLELRALVVKRTPSSVMKIWTLNARPTARPLRCR